jgi:hypothetical protein
MHARLSRQTSEDTFVIGGLQEPELVPGAAKALRGLCDANRKVLMRQ